MLEVFRRSGVGVTMAGCAPEVAPRESRRILCDGYITGEDYVSARRYADAICYSFYPIDLHRSGANGIYQVFSGGGQGACHSAFRASAPGAGQRFTWRAGVPRPV